MGLGPSAILGSTGGFFKPWLVPRNNRHEVHAPSLLGSLLGYRNRGRRHAPAVDPHDAVALEGTLSHINTQYSSDLLENKEIICGT